MIDVCCKREGDIYSCNPRGILKVCNYKCHPLFYNIHQSSPFFTVPSSLRIPHYPSVPHCSVRCSLAVPNHCSTGSVDKSSLRSWTCICSISQSLPSSLPYSHFHPLSAPSPWPPVH